MNVHMAKPTLNFPPIFRALGTMALVFGPSPMLQAHSCPQSLQNSFAHHPQVRQREHNQQLAGVLGQSPIPHLAMTKLALDHAKRVLDLGTDTGFELLQLLEQRVDRTALVHGFALARHHGDVPIHIRVLLQDFFTFLNAPVTRVGKDYFFFAVQQRMRLRDVVGIGRCGRDGMHQPGVGVHANVRLHPKVPLVALLGLVHLGVALTAVVLGRAGRSNQRGIDHGAGLEHQAAFNEFGVDGGQDLLAQTVFFEQMAKAQDRALIGQSHDARIQVRKLLVQRDVVQGLFHGRVGVTKELLQQMDAQHHLGGKRRPTCLARRRMWRNQRQQFSPRDHQVHLVQKLTLARALGDQLESAVGKAHLLHGSTVSDQAVTGLTFADHP